MITTVNAASAYATARRATAPGTPAEGQISPQLRTAADEFGAMMQQTDKTATAAMTGKADTHDLVQSIAETQLALETVVAIRDKVVEAYQEILRMPV
ncbi:MAG: flagellar hook-basal body complex protein FliE [Paracoccus sp. (in: a-proteobacteria)]|nr:flagellar hook-basal body complex protein FliE [Paracoccus sp. (in: a-proteobacteria)]